ncbi:MAG TPA: hypothetical protein V6D12_13205 [Candidatus Obscuribacterales bacterium]
MPIKRHQTERRIIEEERYVPRENTNSGLLLGITIAILLGVAGAAFYFMNQRQESPTQIFLPNNSQPQSAPQSTEKKTTVIERTINQTKEVVPVPQPKAPDTQQKAPSAPEININVPSQQKEAPDVSNQAPDANNSSTQSQDSGTDQNNSSPD